MATDVSPILQRLRRETQGRHEAVEANPFNEALAAGRVTAAQAVWFLSRLYGFVLPCEEQLAAQAAHLDPAWELPARRRAHLIPADVADLLGHPAPPLPRSPVLPSIRTAPEALGALYVLEGSTLGGQVIARQLSTNGLGAARRYFTAYGPLTGPRWQTACRLLAEAATPDTEAAIVAAANRTFDDLATWLSLP